MMFTFVEEESCMQTFMDTDKLKLFVFASMFYFDTGRLLQELVCICLCALLFISAAILAHVVQCWPVMFGTASQRRQREQSGGKHHWKTEHVRSYNSRVDNKLYRLHFDLHSRLVHVSTAFVCVCKKYMARICNSTRWVTGALGFQNDFISGVMLRPYMGLHGEIDVDS